MEASEGLTKGMAMRYGGIFPFSTGGSFQIAGNTDATC